MASDATSLLPAAFLKNTILAHLKWKAADPSKPQELLEWLNRQSEPSVSSERLCAHLETLERRMRGDLSLAAVAASGDVKLQRLRAPSVLMRHIPFATFTFGGIEVSVDYLNPASELGADLVGGTLLEIFLSKCEAPDQCGPLFAELLEDVVEALAPAYVFGGKGTFLGEYLNARHQGRLPETVPVEAFLWPLTYLEGAVEERVVKSLPVAGARRIGKGLLVRVFSDLSNGNEDDYQDAADMLGLRSVWELFAPGRE